MEPFCSARSQACRVRTPADTQPEGRQRIAHGESRGNQAFKATQPPSGGVRHNGDYAINPVLQHQGILPSCDDLPDVERLCGVGTLACRSETHLAARWTRERGTPRDPREAVPSKLAKSGAPFLAAALLLCGADDRSSSSAKPCKPLCEPTRATEDDRLPQA
jgi:hypothetical protein